MVSHAEAGPVALPRRRRPPPQSTRRLAVLIDAETTTAESAEALFDVLADQGTVSVCRAYADWTSPQAQGWWSAPLRRHGIQPYHQFGHDQDQRALVALTIDAVDLARESAVDVVVLVGDLVSSTRSWCGSTRPACTSSPSAPPHSSRRERALPRVRGPVVPGAPRHRRQAPRVGDPTRRLEERRPFGRDFRRAAVAAETCKGGEIACEIPDTILGLPNPTCPPRCVRRPGRARALALPVLVQASRGRDRGDTATYATACAERSSHGCPGPSSGRVVLVASKAVHPSHGLPPSRTSYSPRNPATTLLASCCRPRAPRRTAARRGRVGLG